MSTEFIDVTVKEPDNSTSETPILDKEDASATRVTSVTIGAPVVRTIAESLAQQ